jgi:hypothetical protein
MGRRDGLGCWSGFSCYFRQFFFKFFKLRPKPLLQLFIYTAFAIPAFAGYQAGLDAYHAGDYATAMSEWIEVTRTEPAREDLAIYRESLYAIAMLYWKGEGVGQDYVVSAVWLKQAADINHPGAQAKLGYLYITGEGGARNYSEAARYLEMAAQQGDTDAQNNLAILVREGLIPDSDPAAPAAVPEESPGLLAPGHETRGQDAGEAWILQQDPQHYTIQVIALSKPDKLHAFIQAHPDWSPFAIYAQTRYQKPIWVMVQGNYPDLASARAGRDGFPEGIQQHHELWIRQFRMVQRLIE